VALVLSATLGSVCDAGLSATLARLVVALVDGRWTRPPLPLEGASRADAVDGAIPLLGGCFRHQRLRRGSRGPSPVPL